MASENKEHSDATNFVSYKDPRQQRPLQPGIAGKMQFIEALKPMKFEPCHASHVSKNGDLNVVAARQNSQKWRDSQVGLKYGLSTIAPVDDAGVFTKEAGAIFQGKAVLDDGNTAVLKALGESGNLLKVEISHRPFFLQWPWLPFSCNYPCNSLKVILEHKLICCFRGRFHQRNT